MPLPAGRAAPRSPLPSLIDRSTLASCYSTDHGTARRAQGVCLTGIATQHTHRTRAMRQRPTQRSPPRTPINHRRGGRHPHSLASSPAAPSIERSLPGVGRVQGTAPRRRYTGTAAPSVERSLSWWVQGTGRQGGTAVPSTVRRPLLCPTPTPCPVPAGRAAEAEHLHRHGDCPLASVWIGSRLEAHSPARRSCWARYHLLGNLLMYQKRQPDEWSRWSRWSRLCRLQHPRGAARWPGRFASPTLP